MSRYPTYRLHNGQVEILASVGWVLSAFDDADRELVEVPTLHPIVNDILRRKFAGEKDYEPV